MVFRRTLKQSLDNINTLIGKWSAWKTACWPSAGMPCNTPHASCNW